MQKRGNYINGVEQDIEKAVIPIRSPLDGTTIASVPDSTADVLAQAVDSAQKAQLSWGALTLRQRAELMYDYRELLKKHGEELAEINHKENGKHINEARAGVAKALELVEFSCSLANSDSGSILKVSGDIRCEEERRPLGVVASITPFNFPVMVPHWTVPNALMVGNAMILKPSEQTPLSALYMADLFQQAGLPNGVLSVLHGGQIIVEALCDNEEIKALSFVGSTTVAQIVYKRASASLKRVLSLGGAKNHIVIMPDVDPDIAVRDIIASAYGMAGQRCMAASVLVCVGDCDHILQKLVEHIKNIETGADIPPIISKEARAKLENYLNDPQAKILVDGRKKITKEGGFYIGPSIIEWKTPQEMHDYEVFGPVLEVLRVGSLSEALAIQNASPYGNAASIFTKDGRVAQDAIDGFTAGMLGVNIGIPVPRDPFSFGGIKFSKFGHGDITGKLSLDFWSNTIKITRKWNVDHKRDWMS